MGYLRKILRESKKNYQAWDLLAVSYFHSGLPKRALKILRFSEFKTKNQDYNSYYQGLAYNALKNTKNARKYFQKVAVSRSNYAGPATFELVVSYYNSRKRQKAMEWVQYYLSKFPNGRYVSKALKIRDNLVEKKFNKKIEGIAKPNMEKALFRYSPLSLMDDPHFWYLNFGGDIKLETGKELTTDGNLKDRNDQIFKLNLKAGFGLGPVREKSITAFGGYEYAQYWYSTDERLNFFIKEPSFDYFPFRPDLMVRDHKFYGDLRLELTDHWFSGAYIEYKLSTLGWSLGGPEEINISESSTLIRNDNAFIPWTGISWNKNSRTLFYLFFKKSVDEIEPELSSKSYLFDGAPALSLGLSHTSSFPNTKTTLYAEFFLYEFIYNDPYKDFNRLGGFWVLSHVIFPTLEIDISFSYFQDNYIEARLKPENCRSTPTSDNNNSSNLQIVKCPVTQVGYMIEPQLNWAYKQFYKFFTKFQFVSSNNENIEELAYTQTNFMAGITIAFPSVKRITRYGERFSDKSLTKGSRP